MITVHRYNATQWLDMYARAKVYFHPQHEVISEIAKWSVPILGRGLGRTLSDFPVSLIITKVELASSYLAVLDIVERGISKFRAKTLYELVDSQIYLASLDFRDGKCNRAEIKLLTKGNAVKSVQNLFNYPNFQALSTKWMK